MITQHGVLKDYSGTISSGGTAQDVYSDSQTPKAFVNFQNTSDTAMWIRFGAVAVADKGIYIPAGGYWEPPVGFLPSGRMSVLCATTGKTFLCNVA
jgi:hypothetical protein